MATQLIDIGANLTHESYDLDIDQVIKRSQDAGIAKIIVTASSISESKRVAAMIKQYSGILWGTSGVHPHHAKEADDLFAETLDELIQNENIVAVGECGLDYFRNFSEPREQQKVFRIQLQIALKNSLPIFLHQRDAHNDFIGILKEHESSVIDGVAHCFTGNKKQLQAYLDIGLYIGITGWLCDPRRNQDLIDSIHYIPMDKLLIETDSPYLMPKALEKELKTRRNEPCFLTHVAQAVAEFKKLDLGEVMLKTYQNSERLFFKQKQ